MPQVVVPVRYPLTQQSRATLAEGVRLAEERDGNLTVLHVNLYQNSRSVTRSQLKAAVEREFDDLPRIRYVLRSGLLVEETILDEVAAQDADLVVVGERQVGRWRSVVRRIVGDADVEGFLRSELDCEVVTASAS